MQNNPATTAALWGSRKAIYATGLIVLWLKP